LLASFCSWRSRLFLWRGGLRGFLRRCGFFRSRLFLRLRFGGCLGLFRLFLLQSGFLRTALLLGRRFLDLRLVADELEDRHLRGVAATRAELDDARVAARSLVEARSECREQLRDQGVLAHDALRLTAIVQAVIFSQRDQSLDLRAKLFRLR